MKYPACPECGHRFSLLRGLAAWNPWKYRCPYCRTVLETTGPWKLATLAAIPLGLVIVATAVIREEAGVWHTTDSLLFFLLVFMALFVVWALSWRFVRFRPKGTAANAGRSAHGRPR